MAPMLTLSRAALAVHGVSPAALRQSELTIEAARALEPLLKSRGFDVDRPIHVRELSGFQGFHLAQASRTAPAFGSTDGVGERLTEPGSPAGVRPADVADLIRAKVAIGHLPRKASSRTRVGPGSEHLCDGCEQRIHVNELEHEVDVGLGTLRFHVSCSELWADASALPRHDIAGGSGPSACTLLFERGVAGAARRDPAADADLRSAYAEMRAATAQMRALSGAVRARSRSLRAHARRLRLGWPSSASC
jgi:hypothetical protein